MKDQLKLDLVEYLQDHNEFIKAQTLIKNIPDLKNDGKVRIIINELRQEGNPIISSSNGYKYTTDKVEIYEYCGLLKNRITEFS